MSKHKQCIVAVIVAAADDDGSIVNKKFKKSLYL